MTERRNVNETITARARRLLAFAERQAAQVADWLELHFALYGVDGKATQAFRTEPERAAFMKTKEYKRILALLNQLPGPRDKAPRVGGQRRHQRAATLLSPRRTAG
jgi:hypothetical protein